MIKETSDKMNDVLLRWQYTEKLVNVLEPTLKIIGLKESFVGVTVVAIVPSTAELVNSIKFAMEDNIALSMEVGSAYAVQTALIQVPALVIFSAIYQDL